MSKPLSPSTDTLNRDKDPNNLPEVPSFWERFAFLSLSFEEKALIAEATLDDIKSDGLYWIQLFISSLIASFGLLQNSVAVIIGAMLIAPLLRPIKGIAFGITTGQNSFIWRSTLLLISSMIVTVSAAYLFALLVPLRLETAEIISRTAPNLLDLFIAIASAIIAILAIYYKKLSETTAGVAMAAALLPALCVVGIEFSLSNFEAAWGSFFLFLTNLFAILSVGVIIFLIYGFSPHHEDTKQRTTKSVFILFILLILISIPLFSSLTQIADKISLQTKALQVVEESLTETIPEARLEQLVLTDFDDDNAEFFGTIKIPENTDFFLETRNAIREQLGNALEREVTLSMEIIPIASIVSEQEKMDEALPGKDKQILNLLKAFFSRPDLKTTVINFDVVQSEENPYDETEGEDGIPRSDEDVEKHIPEKKWTVRTVFTLPAGESFDENIQINLEEEVQSLFPDDTFTFLWVPLSQTATGKTQKVETPNDRYLQEVSLQWESFFKRTLPEDSDVDNLQITWEVNEEETDSESTTLIFDQTNIAQYYVNFDLMIPEEEAKKSELLREKMRLFARINFDKPVELKMRVFPFTTQELVTKP
jgi:uncharacterized hydrophobic protein (TIGR00271 family)